MYYATKYLRLSYTSDRANESDSIANQRKYAMQVRIKMPLYYWALREIKNCRS